MQHDLISRRTIGPKNILAIMALLLSFSLNLLAEPFPTSGYDFLPDDMKEIQDDDFLNPGMDTVDKGLMHFQDEEYESSSCANCHGDHGEYLNREKIAGYPRYSEEHERVITLQEQINLCGIEKLDRFPLEYDEDKLVALETFVRSKANGQIINVEVSDESRDFFELGKSLYNRRFGQMGMTCSHCHVQYQGIMLRGSKLTQGQTNGFPVYRIDSRQITTIHQRYNECFLQLRAEPYQRGSKEYRALEYYMGVLSNGLKVETPGVRY